MVIILCFSFHSYAFTFHLSPYTFTFHAFHSFRSTATHSPFQLSPYTYTFHTFHSFHSTAMHSPASMVERPLLPAQIRTRFLDREKVSATLTSDNWISIINVKIKRSQQKSPRKRQVSTHFIFCLWYFKVVFHADCLLLGVWEKVGCFWLFRFFRPPLELINSPCLLNFRLVYAYSRLSIANPEEK